MIFDPNRMDTELPPPNERFPECLSTRSMVALCYCRKLNGNNPPVLGIDVDICLRGQTCNPGDGIANARCVWTNPDMQAMVSRLWAAYSQSHANCFGQDLNRGRCL